MASVLLSAGVLAAGCHRRPVNDPPVHLVWTINPTRPVVGPATLSVTLRNRAGQPLTGVQVRLEAHMTHPGMAPVQADAVERGAGLYDIPFSFTMPGDWVLLVSATTPHGERTGHRIDVANVRPPG